MAADRDLISMAPGPNAEIALRLARSYAARRHRCVQTKLRANDQLGRFGGEEFLIVLPETSLGHAAACAERLRGAVAALHLLIEQAGDVTVSTGLAECAAGESAKDLMARIDAALYRARREGRNRVAINTPTDPVRMERSTALA